MPGNEQEWISSRWKLHNWNNNKEDGSTSLTVTIPTDNYDPTKAVQAVLKHNKAVSDQNLKRAAQRNREDISLVWIYSDENGIKFKKSLIICALLYIRFGYMLTRKVQKR